MDKKTNYIITIEENGKYYSYADAIQNCNNLVRKFPKNATSINACSTRKQAEKIAQSWNESWKEQGKLNYEIRHIY